jgi:hypothetical protein
VSVPTVHLNLHTSRVRLWTACGVRFWCSVAVRDEYCDNQVRNLMILKALAPGSRAYWQAERRIPVLEPGDVTQDPRAVTCLMCLATM